MSWAYSESSVTVSLNTFLVEGYVDTVLSVNQVLALSSGAAVNGNRGWNGYSISKAGLNMLIKLYSKECDKTHFTAIAPGLVHTKMMKDLLNLKVNEKFPSLLTLKNSVGTEKMQQPYNAALNIINNLQNFKTSPSGEFIDIRSI